MRVHVKSLLFGIKNSVTFVYPPASRLFFHCPCFGDLVYNMRDFRDPVEINKRLYPYNSGVFQINVERCIDSNLSWSPIIEIPAGQSEAPHDPPPKLFHTMIICALHPTLFPNQRVSWLADRLRLQYVTESQFRSVILSCILIGR